MYLAYLKNNIEVGTTNEGIVFNERKESFKNKLLILHKSVKNNKYYMLNETKIIFTEEWLDCLTSFDSSTFIQVNTFSLGFIVRKNYTDGKYYDIETNKRIDSTHSVIYDYECVLTNAVSSFETSKALIDCIHCNEKIKCNSFSYIDGTCLDCYDKMRRQCEYCGGYFISKNENKYKTENGEMILCDNCLSIHDKCVNCDILCIPNPSLNV